LELEVQASEVQTLMDLGLSSAQAKIYFILAKFGPLTVTEVAKHVKTGTSSTYCTLLKLYELGIVEKRVLSKTKFEAFSADQTLKVLLQKQEAKSESFPVTSIISQDGLKKSKGFVVIPNRDQIVKQALRLVNKTRQSLEVVVSWSFFSEFVYETFPEKFCPNVPKQCIIQQPPESKSLELIKKFKIQSNTQLRFVQPSPKAMLAIFDKKEALMIEKPELPDSPAFWTNNPAMLLMAQNYFDNLWKESTQKPVLKKRC
jgi:sugar-specific transcriptional regulator TrmB